MPTLLQASISRVPGGAVTFLPSTVMFTSGIKLSFVFSRSRTAMTLADDERPRTKDCYAKTGNCSTTPAFSNGQGRLSR
jgi:hypothetical protein